MSLFLILAATLLLYIFYILLKSVRRPKNYPPGPGFLPWLGNAVQFRKEARAAGGQHILFEQWSKRYKSDILGLKLGKDFVVVALGYANVRDVHLLEVFEGRPDNFFLRLRTMGTRKGITFTDGKLWYEHRNFAMKQMRHVGYGRSQMEEHIEREADGLLQYIAETKAASVWPGSFLAQSVLNVLWCLIAGERIERDNATLVKLLDLLNRRSKLFDICGGLLAQFPWLRFIAPDKTGYNLIRQMNTELHNLFMETIEEHKVRLNEKGSDTDSDLIFAYLREMQQPQLECGSEAENSTFNESQLIMTILDFFIAGSQTTSTTITLALMVLALRPDMQAAVYKETQENRHNSASDQFPHLKNRAAYAYMDAFIMEVQRFFHITPVTGPRRTLWDTTLGGYNIPKNTTVLISLRSIHLDETHWTAANEFKPERFIDAEGKAFKDEYFMPFGMGRRRCLGDALARACIFSFLVKIIQNFSIVLADGEQPSWVLQPGITLSPKPYKVKFIKRD